MPWRRRWAKPRRNPVTRARVSDSYRAYKRGEAQVSDVRTLCDFAQDYAYWRAVELGLSEGEALRIADEACNRFIDRVHRCDL